MTLFITNAMAFELALDTEIPVSVKTIKSYRISKYVINPIEKTILINYQGLDGVSVLSGGQILIEKDEYDAVMAATNPADTPISAIVGGVLYAKLMSKLGVTGTIVP